MKIAVASDHAGFEIKEYIKKWLIGQGHEVIDFGTSSSDSVDYSDYGHKLAEHIEANKEYIGIAVCGSGNGINITLNKHQGIRAALCWNKEISQLARAHNNANICSIPGRFVKPEESIEIVSVFLTTPFEGGRHQTRIDKIPLTCK
jgi:ribose 5-phosphate isomerase B